MLLRKNPPKSQSKALFLRETFPGHTTFKCDSVIPLLSTQSPCISVLPSPEEK